MVDLGLAKRSVTNVDELVSKYKNIALGQEDNPERMCRVTREDIRAKDMSFTPSRYLQKQVTVGPNALALDELCDVLRAPLLSRDDNAVEYFEVGIADTSSWLPIRKEPIKRAQIRPRPNLPTLAKDDLVLSIKGTVGKTGLLGEVKPDSTVVSQNCLALRIKPGHRELISPEFLLVYLRSANGQAQLQGLQAGTAIQHINPQTLMNSFLVPMPTVQEKAAVETEYLQLCALESEIASLEQKMEVLTGSRWPS